MLACRGFHREGSFGFGEDFSPALAKCMPPRMLSLALHLSGTLRLIQPSETYTNGFGVLY